MPDPWPSSGLPFDPALLDTPLRHRQSADAVDELFRQVKKHVYELTLSGEPTHPHVFGRGEAMPSGATNVRNGTAPKTVLTESGPIALARSI